MDGPVLSFGQDKEECFLKKINMDRQDEQDKRHKTAEVQLFYPVYPC
jgi:hypothetical protein